MSRALGRALGSVVLAWAMFLGGGIALVVDGGPSDASPVPSNGAPPAVPSAVSSADLAATTHWIRKSLQSRPEDVAAEPGAVYTAFSGIWWNGLSHGPDASADTP